MMFISSACGPPHVIALQNSLSKRSPASHHKWEMGLQILGGFGRSGRRQDLNQMRSVCKSVCVTGVNFLLFCCLVVSGRCDWVPTNSILMKKTSFVVWLSREDVSPNKSISWWKYIPLNHFQLNCTIMRGEKLKKVNFLQNIFDN